ncbi:histidine phosphatase family protein [Streptomyces sp. NPDC051658]|uniref:histidine phosphatase family protein n=1 Tax=Streptomyces sp. NPDC051658 TaxID=3365667 RepID=UPI0037988A4E
MVRRPEEPARWFSAVSSEVAACNQAGRYLQEGTHSCALLTSSPIQRRHNTSRKPSAQLTPAGVRAAVSIAQAVRSQVPDGAEVELFSSDLQRTLRTAEEVAELFGVKPVLDRRLREKSYGEAEGKPQEWLDRRFVPPPAVGERMEHDEGVEDAETKAACAQRIYEAMDEILQSLCGHQIIGTHGGSLTCVVASWIRMPIESASYASFRALSGSITTLREDDVFHNRQVVSLGDSCHLDSAKAG